MNVIELLEREIKTLEHGKRRIDSECERLADRIHELREARDLVEDLKVTSKGIGSRLNPVEWVRTYHYDQQTKDNDTFRQKMREELDIVKNRGNLISAEIEKKKVQLRAVREMEGLQRAEVATSTGKEVNNCEGEATGGKESDNEAVRAEVKTGGSERRGGDPEGESYDAAIGSPTSADFESVEQQHIDAGEEYEIVDR
eukprot:GHVU01019806.1.p1 GENE.GHVU01019806.1~~GHVU01019806.1.p1  ORF type:complete len:199 (-),score=31.98 GHVU01019806.1:244-840(-)